MGVLLSPRRFLSPLPPRPSKASLPPSPNTRSSSASPKMQSLSPVSVLVASAAADVASVRGVKATIAPYKYPRWLEFVAELPKTATGKIQRFKLRDLEKARSA